MARYYRLPFPNPNRVDGFGSTLGRKSPHRGVDFPQPPGTPITAIADGTVALIEHSTALGWVTVVKHTRPVAEQLRGRKPVFSGYAHQDSPGWRISVGQGVKLGAVIGHVGYPGRSGTASTGAHLHLTMSHELRGVFVGEVFDPLKFIGRYPQPRARAAKAPATYTVRDGDTLWEIADDHGTTVRAITELNRIDDPDLIRAGQKLRLP